MITHIMAGLLAFGAYGTLRLLAAARTDPTAKVPAIILVVLFTLALPLFIYANSTGAYDRVWQVTQTTGETKS